LGVFTLKTDKKVLVTAERGQGGKQRPRQKNREKNTIPEKASGGHHEKVSAYTSGRFQFWYKGKDVSMGEKKWYGGIGVTTEKLGLEGKRSPDSGGSQIIQKKRGVPERRKTGFKRPSRQAKFPPLTGPEHGTGGSKKVRRSGGGGTTSPKGA